MRRTSFILFAVSGLVVAGAFQAIAGRTTANDLFTRTVDTGWGAADTGQSWSESDATDAGVRNGSGYLISSPSRKNHATIAGTFQNVEVIGRVRVNKVPAYSHEEVTQGFQIRKSASAYLWVELVCRAGKAAELQTQYMSGGTKVLEASMPAPYGACVARTWYWMTIHVSSVNGTTTEVKAKTWADGSAEPGWQSDVFDSHHDVQGPGGITYQVCSNNTRDSEGTFRHRLDDFQVISL